jgi:hypothetical protein
MRIARLFFAGSAALAVLAAPAVPSAPALAKNSNVQKNEDKPASPPSCHAYKEAADGSWIELPCQEGSAAPAPAQRKSATKGPDEDTR